jgi:tRNA pseudouridine55 synthase
VKPDLEAGAVLLFDKPLRWTSFDLVKKIRNLTGVSKIGHAGTLDPLATGLLILCTGKKTREIENFMGQEKEYTGTFYLGETTPSYDRETEVNAQYPVEHIDRAALEMTAKNFTGQITQYPPAHSAVKVKGKRAYELARKGLEPELKPRHVLIKEFEITGIEMPLVHFRVICSKGTYIRSLANDFGKELGSGACLHALCRTRIGNFLLRDAFTIEQFTAIAGKVPPETET